MTNVYFYVPYFFYNPETKDIEKAVTEFTIDKTEISEKAWENNNDTHKISRDYYSPSDIFWDEVADIIRKREGIKECSCGFGAFYEIRDI